ncbi:MAG: HlyC/CorC family transporter [Planctomycetes bacterium]|nr:HlyC/CorC family transporter [Planctomycetota bacterium]
MALLLTAVLVALSVSFLCSLMEAALLSLTPGQLATLGQRHPRAAAAWQHFKDNIERPISAILTLNTIAHTIGAFIAGAQVESLFGKTWLAAFSIIFTYLMLQFTEILPKSLGVRFNSQVALVAGRPLSTFVLLLRPINWFIHLVNRPFEPRRKDGRPASPLHEITALAGLARLSNLIDSRQERIIQGATHLSKTTARQVMVPAQDITFLSTRQDIGEAIVTMHMDPHTRFPLREGDDSDRILGYVNFKDLIAWARTNPADPSLRGVARPVRFVAPDESAAVLLKLFVDQHIHIAIVRDAAGHTLGLITMEDLVEELVGDLEDEYDRLPRSCQALTAGTLMVGGACSVAEVAQALGAALPDPQGTLSAWLERQLGRQPKIADTLSLAGRQFTVRRMRRGRVFEVLVTQPQQEKTAS